MKFTKKLEANKRPQWAQHYMDYKALKKLLSALTEHEKSAADAEGGADAHSRDTDEGEGGFSVFPNTLLSGLLAHDEALEEKAEKLGLPLAPKKKLEQKDGTLMADGDIFLRAVMGQWDIVEAFYEAEMARAHEQLAGLMPQLQRANLKGDIGLTDHERSSITRAITSLYRELQHLRNFCIVNYTGFIKILKKHDKALRSKPLSALARPMLDVLPFVAAGDEPLLEQVEKAFADAFCDGNVQVARNDLLVRKQRGTSRIHIALGMRLGFAASLFLWLVWDLVVDTSVLDLPTPRRHRWSSFVQFQVPVFRFCGALALGWYMWGVVLYLWGKARINYLFMFELAPEEALGPAEAFSLGTRQLTLVLLTLLLEAKVILNELPEPLPSGLFAAALFIASVAQALVPLRRGFLFFQSTFRVLAAPLVPVDLWSTFYADALTSLVKPITDLFYSLCYVGTGEWLLSSVNQGECQQSKVFTSVVMPLCCALPLWCRFMQNLRVYHDTHRRWPSLPNALKYAVSMLVVLFGALHPNAVSVTGGIAFVQAGWISTYLISTLYTFVWDVRMDWRLAETKHLYLRQRLMFGSKPLYYSAIAIDLVLRFGWTTTLSPGEISRDLGGTFGAITLHLARFAVMSAEMFRRSMWAVLRLEAEHLHNTEGFRRVDIIPLHFDRKPQRPKRHGGDAGEEGQERSRTVLIMELLGYVAMVALLTTLSALIRPGHPGVHVTRAYTLADADADADAIAVTHADDVTDAVANAFTNAFTLADADADADADTNADANAFTRAFTHAFTHIFTLTDADADAVTDAFGAGADAGVGGGST